MAQFEVFHDNTERECNDNVGVLSSNNDYEQKFNYRSKGERKEKFILLCVAFAALLLAIAGLGVSVFAINKINLTSQNESKKLAQPETDCLVFGGLVYKNKCIFLAYPRGTGNVFSVSKTICEMHDSKLCEILNDEMYEKVYNYARHSWIGYTDCCDTYLLQLWLGSTYNTENNPDGLMTLSNGTRIASKKWHPGFPSTSPTRTHMVMQLRTLTTRSPDEGLYNQIPTFRQGVPLCERPLLSRIKDLGAK